MSRRPRKSNLIDSIREELPEIPVKEEEPPKKEEKKEEMKMTSEAIKPNGPKKRGRPKLIQNISPTLTSNDIKPKLKLSLSREDEDEDCEIKIIECNDSSYLPPNNEKKSKEHKIIGQKIKVFINEKPLLDEKIDKIVRKLDLDEIPQEYMCPTSPPEKKIKTAGCHDCHTAEKLNMTKEELQIENDKIKRSLRYYRHNKHHQLLRNIIRDSREPINNKDAIFILDLIKCYTR